MGEFGQEACGNPNRGGGMKKILLVGAIVMMATIVKAEVTYKVREEVAQQTEEVKPVEVKNYYADIYVNGNLLVSGIKVTSEADAKSACEQYITKYNTDNKKSYPTTVGVAK